KGIQFRDTAGQIDLWNWVAAMLSRYQPRKDTQTPFHNQVVVKAFPEARRPDFHYIQSASRHAVFAGKNLQADHAVSDGLHLAFVLAAEALVQQQRGA